MNFEAKELYVLSKNNSNRYYLYKKSVSEYIPIGEIWDLSEVSKLFPLLNGSYEDLNSEFIPTLAEAEAEHMQSVLDRFKGNLTRAATCLHISRSTMYRKVKKYNLTTEQQGEEIMGK